MLIRFPPSQRWPCKYWVALHAAQELSACSARQEGTTANLRRACWKTPWVIFCLHITPINILINNTPIRIRSWPGETDPNPKLARRNRSESEPGKDESDPNPNSGKAIRTRGLRRGGPLEIEVKLCVEMKFRLRVVVVHKRPTARPQTFATCECKPHEGRVTSS